MEEEDHGAGPDRRYVHVYAISGYCGVLNLIHLCPLFLSGSLFWDRVLAHELVF